MCGRARLLPSLFLIDDQKRLCGSLALPALHEHDDVSVFVYLNRIRRDPGVAVVKSLAGDQIELPPVPRTSQYSTVERRIKFANVARPMRRVQRPLT